MKTSLLSLTILGLFLSSAALAVSGKVTKAKGNSAIVVFDGPVTAGDLVSVGGDVDGSTPAPSSGWNNRFNKRDYAFGYHWVSQSQTITGPGFSTNVTTHNGTATFWVVFNNFEVAPVFSYQTSSTNVTTTTFGLIGQYDFTKNQPGVVMVPGVYLTYLIASATSNNGFSTTTNSNNTIGAGGSIDWFPFGEHVALNFRLEYDSITLQSNSAISTSQFQFISGVKVYF